MARYIDADKFKNNLEKAMEKMHLIGGVKGVDVGAVIVALDRQPTANVVPTERLENALKILEKTEDELYGPEGEVTKLTAELNAMRGAANSYKMHYENAKAEVAMEIFAEIYENCFDQFGYIDYKALSELKKKYTEGVVADGDKQE